MDPIDYASASGRTNGSLARMDATIRAIWLDLPARGFSGVEFILN